MSDADIHVQNGVCMIDAGIPLMHLIEWTTADKSAILCNTCGAELPDISAVVGIFVGHVEVSGVVYDAIHRTDKFVCPHCDTNHKWYLLECPKNTGMSLADMLFNPPKG